MKLDNRLKAVAAMVPPGKTIADIGTDHAYLPVCLLQKGLIKAAIAGDLKCGPCQAAQRTVREAALFEYIQIRQGDGLQVVAPGEAEVLIIAGMGGSSIAGILSARPKITAAFERIIVQPMTGAALVRQYFRQNGWQIVAEDLVADETKIYQIIAAEKGLPSEFDVILDEIGELNWQNRHPLLKNLLLKEMTHLKNVAASLAKSKSERNISKYRQYCQMIEKMEEKLLCL
ncbi:MAG: class I SAM-dependent methyltransferase [Sporomusaceae bacterium]|nr:class I SAM-dependent methyltransferase [Sporomusaceae bacterium]